MEHRKDVLEDYTNEPFVSVAPELNLLAEAHRSRLLQRFLFASQQDLLVYASLPLKGWNVNSSAASSARLQRQCFSRAFNATAHPLATSSELVLK